jgi:hypothetical protein
MASWHLDSNVRVGQIVILSNPLLELCSDHFPSQGVLNEDPTVWLDLRQPPISLIMSLTNSQFELDGPYEINKTLFFRRHL